MADLCPTCGIRLDDGLCQCPEVLLRRVHTLEHIIAGGIHALPSRADAEQIRSLRAKLMRERAVNHDWAQLDALRREAHARASVLDSCARRLRAEAERIERGK